MQNASKVSNAIDVLSSPTAIHSFRVQRFGGKAIMTSVDATVYSQNR